MFPDYLICLRRKNPKEFNDCMNGNEIFGIYRVALESDLDRIELNRSKQEDHKA